MAVVTYTRKSTGVTVILAITILAVWLFGFGDSGTQWKETAYTLLSTDDDALLKDITNSTLGFQKIFVINMKSRTDHRDSMVLAASLAGIDLEFMDAATEVNAKALPPGGNETALTRARLGVWRSHLNNARRIVQENIQSALIFEDDIDWDIRIKPQLQQFARASRLLLQPLPGTKDQFLDPTYFNGPSKGQEPGTFVVGQHQVTPPTTSPYGDLSRWDMLWLGHCGATPPTGQDGLKTPLARAAILNDETVAQAHQINQEFGTADFKTQYPDHTRLVFRTGGNVCTLAYALSLQGARRMLYEFGVHRMDGEIDTMLDAFCRGRMNRTMATCLTSIPQYFSHHRPVGSWSDFSDIVENNPSSNDRAYSENLRHGTKVNFDKLLSGDTNYSDPYPDREPNVGL